MAISFDEQLRDTALESHMKTLDECRMNNERQRVNVEKVNALRILLAESFVGGPKNDPAFTPVLTDKETGRVKKKLFEIIDRL